MREGVVVEHEAVLPTYFYLVIITMTLVLNWCFNLEKW